MKRMKCLMSCNTKYWLKGVISHLCLKLVCSLTIKYFNVDNQHFYFNLLVLDLGSLGPSTVTLIALDKVATCGGDVCNMIVRVKLFPETIRKSDKVKGWGLLFYWNWKANPKGTIAQPPSELKTINVESFGFSVYYSNPIRPTASPTISYLNDVRLVFSCFMRFLFSLRSRPRVKNKISKSKLNVKYLFQCYHFP